jgi:hypothetical protein
MGVACAPVRNGTRRKRIYKAIQLGRGSGSAAIPESLLLRSVSPFIGPPENASSLMQINSQPKAIGKDVYIRAA